ncbi:hypothetical protein B9Z19DRAFT_1079138 [Tuber borchii]|uniref:Uncharacterized protein n=1 Tax=Tuber borchii TaxID=42251 RepID=A0A2T6ZYG7_TUBBO|nr:hypothetical protein B9Z19DRAFT_1079138 [Tuber borchii]
MNNQTQHIERRYIRKNMLMRLLTQLFGENFEIEVIDESYRLNVPRPLTEEEIEQISL